MDKLNFTGIIPVVVNRLTPMLEELLGKHAADLHSIHLVGSAVISDYDEKLSDINSVVVLHEMDLRFIAFLAPLGKKYGRKKITAPLVMTPQYIQDSLDAFPVEFFDFKLIHKTIYGVDIFKDLRIAKPHLRLQCEREVKTKLIGLRQGYISSLGGKEHLAAMLVRSFTGSMALFRAIIFLLGKEPPVARQEVVKAFCAATGTEIDIYENLLKLKTGLIKPSEHELRSLFELYYDALEVIGKIINGLPV